MCILGNLPRIIWMPSEVQGLAVIDRLSLRVSMGVTKLDGWPCEKDQSRYNRREKSQAGGPFTEDLSVEGPTMV